MTQAQARTSNDAAARFSNRVDDYVRYRPTYPSGLFDLLSVEYGLAPRHVIADVGSGTGILTSLLLDRGHRVFAVEPNEPMRRAAELALSNRPGFVSVAGSAEATTLPEASVDWVMAAQAFHWFDVDAARREFARILRAGTLRAQGGDTPTNDAGARRAHAGDAGYVALIWNNRREDTPFLRDYEAFLHAFGTDYAKVKHQNTEDDGRIASFFGSRRPDRHTLPNTQALNLEGLIGRTFSCSYMPSRDDARYAATRTEVERLFHQHERDGRVLFEYDTRAYVGRLE